VIDADYEVVDDNKKWWVMSETWNVKRETWRVIYISHYTISG
jgi:hypothetical protein